MHATLLHELMQYRDQVNFYACGALTFVVWFSFICNGFVLQTAAIMPLKLNLEQYFVLLLLLLLIWAFLNDLGTFTVLHTTLEAYWCQK